MNYSDKLKHLLKVSGWSQEKLAVELSVSFPTLNSWINERSQPRKSSLQKIDILYANILGVDSTVEKSTLKAFEVAVRRHRLTVNNLVSDEIMLNKLILNLTYHTNTIEGSTMTLADVNDVLFDSKVLANRTAIEQLEAHNHKAALLWLLDKVASDGKNFKLTTNLIESINTRLMNGIISNAGQYRQHAVRILGSRVPLSNWQMIPDNLDRFVDTFCAIDGSLIKHLAKSHAEFEKIHPFSDGNGRTGRLILLAQALVAGVVPPIIPKHRKHAYYKYLEVAQTRGVSEPLEQFIAESIIYSAETIGVGKKVIGE